MDRKPTEKEIMYVPPINQYNKNSYEREYLNRKAKCKLIHFKFKEGVAGVPDIGEVTCNEHADALIGWQTMPEENEEE